MKAADVVEALRRKLAVLSGRHLYGVLGSTRTSTHSERRYGKQRHRTGGAFPNR